MIRKKAKKNTNLLYQNLDVFCDMTVYQSNVTVFWADFTVTKYANNYSLFVGKKYPGIPINMTQHLDRNN